MLSDHFFFPAFGFLMGFLFAPPFPPAGFFAPFFDPFLLAAGLEGEVPFAGEAGFLVGLGFGFEPFGLEAGFLVGLGLLAALLD